MGLKVNSFEKTTFIPPASLKLEKFSVVFSAPNPIPVKCPENFDDRFLLSKGKSNPN